MAKMNRMDSRGSPISWFLVLVLLIYAMYSLAVAATTADKCDGMGREWQIAPPEWVCKPTPGFG